MHSVCPKGVKKNLVRVFALVKEHTQKKAVRKLFI